MLVHTEPFRRKYLASICGSASICVYISIVIIVILPFVLAFAGSAFWLRQNVTIEIPTVEYRHHAILQVGSPLDTRPRIWTTSSALNGLLGSQLVPASIEVIRNTPPSGRSPHSFDVIVRVPVETSRPVQSFRLMLFFDYVLSSRYDIPLESLVYLDYSSAVPASSLYTSSVLRLVQMKPIQSSTTMYNTTSFFPGTSASLADINFRSILARYAQNSFRTRLEEDFVLWESGWTDEFVFRSTIRIPEQSIDYIPGGWEAFKMGWIQYVAFLLPVALLCWFIKGILIASGLLSSYIVVDSVPKAHQF